MCQKTLLALLPAGAEAAEGYCCFFRPAAPVTAAEAAASETAHLLVCSADADAALYTLYTSDARNPCSCSRPAITPDGNHFSEFKKTLAFSENI